MRIDARLQNSAPWRVMFKSQFGLYLFGNTFSLIGTWMQRIACSWLVWDWTGSAFWVGILAACDLFPVIAIAPFAGVAADRWDRLRQNVFAQIISAVNAVALAVALATGHLGLAAILFLVFVQGALTAATQPSRFAMVQQMVPREDVGAAVGLNSACVNIARLLGPAVAGTLILHSDIFWVFALNAAVTVAFVFTLLRLKLAPVEPRKGAEPFLAQMLEGFRYVAEAAPLRLILFTLFCGGALIRSVIELMPVVAAQAFEDTVTGLAVLTGAAAIGAITSGLTVGRTSTKALYKAAPIWWGIGAIAAIVLTQTSLNWLNITAALGLGAAITRGLVSTQTFLQLTTPDALRGRTLSVFGLVARGSPAFGALAVGYAADRIGLGAAVLVASGSLIGILVTLAVPMFRASLRIVEAT